MAKEGKHIIIQCYQCTAEPLKSVAKAKEFLIEAVNAAEMRTLGEPHVYDIKTELKKMGVEPNQLEPEGVTGIVALSTSHVAIHTWPHRLYLVLDVFSCRDFRTGDIVNVLDRVFHATMIKVVDVSFSLDIADLLPEEDGLCEGI